MEVKFWDSKNMFLLGASKTFRNYLYFINIFLEQIIIFGFLAIIHNFSVFFFCLLQKAICFQRATQVILRVFCCQEKKKRNMTNLFIIIVGDYGQINYKKIFH